MKSKSLYAVAALGAAVVVSLLLLRAPSPSPPVEDVDPQASVPAADHHMHVFSAAAVDLLLRAQEEMGEEVIPPDQARPLTAANAIAALDSAGIERGVLLSTAYFFASPLMEVEPGREQDLVRAENEYVRRQVAEDPDRLTGFFSVNPLSDYALTEIERAAGTGGFAGLKLHMGNSRLDLSDSSHVARLAEVFRRCNELDMAIVIHLKNPEREYGRGTVQTFVDEVLGAAPDVPVQVAHLAGDGGWDDASAEAIDAFATAVETRPDLTRNLFFDYSATPIPLSLAEGNAELEEQIRGLNQGVVEALRKLDPERLLYGTDWPAVSAPGYLEFRTSVPMDESELAAILASSAPYLP